MSHIAESLNVVSLAELVQHVLQSPPKLGPVRLICVDGPAGSGKSTLARRLRTAVRALAQPPLVQVVHMDDLYEGWTGAEKGVATLREDVLVPLAAGRDGSYRRYDWHAERYAERHVVRAEGLLIVEGVSSAARGVEPWPSLRIWVETDEATRLRRGLERDGEALRPLWEEWMRWEQEHFAADETRDRADLVVDGSPTVAHDPETQLVATISRLPAAG